MRTPDLGICDRFWVYGKGGLPLDQPRPLLVPPKYLQAIIVKIGCRGSFQCVIVAFEFTFPWF